MTQEQINKIISEKFIGKTIKKIDADATNAWTFYFTDDSETSIEVESVYPSMGLYGIAISGTDENNQYT